MQSETKKDAFPSNCPTEQLSISNGIYKRFFKRPLDFLLSLIALIILSPLLLLIAILVRVKLGSPVIFKQQRPGLNEKIFTIYKFRTMTDEKDENGELLPDSDRLTPFGKFLRSTSIDELPELVNILKGDMSIVGPRPQLVIDMVFMTTEQRIRHRIRPGLTGWAQVNGRNNVTWEEKLSLDLEYLREITFVKDIEILFMTIIKVFKKEDILAVGMETPEDLGDYMLRIGKVNREEYEVKREKANRLISRYQR